MSHGPSRNGTSRRDDARLADAWRAVRRHWPLALGIPAVVVFATAAFLLTVTPIYQQSTSIRIEQEEPDIPLLSQVEGFLPGLTGGGSGVETEMEVLRSRTIAEDVVDSLGLQLVLESPRRTPRSLVLSRIDVSRDAEAAEYRLERVADGRFQVEVEWVPDPDDKVFWVLPRKVTEPVGEFAVGSSIPLLGGTATLMPEAAGLESIRFRVDAFNDAVEALRDETGVSRPTREADIVVASHTGPDPILVRDATNGLAHTFIERHRALKTSEARSTVGFLDDQIRALSLQLAGAEDALRAFREQNLVIAPEAEASAQMERLAEMQADRDAIAAEGAALQELLSEVEAGTPTEAGDSSEYRRLIAFPTLFRNPAASELLGQLAEVENERARLLNRRTAEDIDVRVLTNRIREIEWELRNLATTYLQGLRQQVASLDATLAGYRSELERVPQREIEYGRLLRQATVLNEIYLALQNRLKEAELRVAIQDVGARVVDPAILPDDPVKPNIPVSMVFALFLGAVLGLGGALARDAMDRTVRTRDDLQQAVGLTVLGAIPRTRERGNGRLGRDREPRPTRLVTNADPRGPFVEAYRALQTSIAFAVPDRRPRTVVFTSALPGDGSATAVNLALTLAQQEMAVLLVDADLRRGALHDLFDRGREPGLADVIRGEAALEDAVQRVAPEGYGRLDFLASGARPANPAELLGSEPVRRLIEQWRTGYEMIVFDAPPLNAVADAAILGTHTDGVVLVARAGVTDRDAVQYALERLENVRAPVLGTVLSDLDMRQESRAGAAAAYAYLHGSSP